MKQLQCYLTILFCITSTQIIQATPEDIRIPPHDPHVRKEGEAEDFVLVDFPQSSQAKRDTPQPTLTAATLAQHNKYSPDRRTSTSQSSESSSFLSSILGPELDKTPAQAQRPLPPMPGERTPSLRQSAPTDLGEVAPFNINEATVLAAFNIQSQPRSRHTDSNGLCTPSITRSDSEQDVESQKKKSPLSSSDSLSYQNSINLQNAANNPSAKEDNRSCGLLDCFKSCWSSRKKKKT